MDCTKCYKKYAIFEDDQTKFFIHYLDLFIYAEIFDLHTKGMIF